MKKVLAAILLACLVSLLLCCAALADGTDPALPEDSGIYNVTPANGATYLVYNGDEPVGAAEGSYIDSSGAGMTNYYPEADNVSVTLGGVTPGSFYLVLATEKELSAPPTQSSEIFFIDQATVTAGGSVTFKVYPRALAAEKTYYIYAVGNGSGAGDLTTLTLLATFKYFVPYTLGDVNDNGFINAMDASTVLRYVVASDEDKPDVIPDRLLPAADVNKNGFINAMDASTILRYVVASDEDKPFIFAH